MSPEQPQTPEANPNKDAFFQTVSERLQQLNANGNLPEAYVAGVLERAGLIEGPFNSAEDAQAKAAEYLKSVEPVAEFMRRLNTIEIKILASTGEIELAIADLDKITDMGDEEKKTILNTLELVRDQFDAHLRSIQVARTRIV